MKILFFKIGAIGDVLMTTPLVRQTRKLFPNAKIDYLVGQSASQVLDGNKNIDNIITFDETIFTEKKLKAWYKLVKKVRLEKYDTIFVLDKHWFFNFTAYAFNIKKRVGFNRLGKEGLFLTKKQYYGPIRHEIYYYLDLLHKITKKVNYDDTKLDIDIKKTKLPFSKYVVLVNSGGNNPGEESKIRKLPDNTFRKLIEELVINNNLVFLGTKNEKEYYDKFIINKKVKNLAGKYNIKESASIMQNASRIYTTDCGAMHMGAAVNDNITAFFGPTHPERKKPLVRKLKVIWTDSQNYDDSYELFGTKTKNKFFNKIKKSDIK